MKVTTSRLTVLEAVASAAKQLKIAIVPSYYADYTENFRVVGGDAEDLYKALVRLEKLGDKDWITE